MIKKRNVETETTAYILPFHLSVVQMGREYQIQIINELVYTERPICPCHITHQVTGYHSSTIIFLDSRQKLWQIQDRWIVEKWGNVSNPCHVPCNLFQQLLAWWNESHFFFFELIPICDVSRFSKSEQKKKICWICPEMQKGI